MDDKSGNNIPNAYNPVANTDDTKEPLQPTVFNLSVPPSLTTLEAVSSSPTQEEPAPSLSSPSGKGKKLGGKLFVLVAAGVLLLAGGASAYLGVVVPNKPENVWRKSLENTSKGYDKLVGYADSQKDKRSSKAELDVRVEAQGVVVDGKIQAENDKDNSKGTVDVSFLGKDVSLEFLSETKEGAAYPDVYLKAAGLSPLAEMLAPEYQPIATQLEDKWLVVGSELIEQATQQSEDSDELQLTSEDYNELLNAFGRTTKEYLLATDDKAVMQVAEFAGKEKMDGRAVDHYKVKIHKQNLKSYISALETELKKTEAAKYLGDSFSLDSVQDSIDNLKDDETVDVWVDSSTKLIRTVRITDRDNKNNTFDFGLKYTGGDAFPFYIALKAGDADVQSVTDLTVTLNTKDNRLDMVGSVKVSGEQTVDASLKGNIVIGDFAVDVSTPNDAEPIETFMQNLFGGTRNTVLGQSQSNFEAAELFENQGFDFDY